MEKHEIPYKFAEYEIPLRLLSIAILVMHVFLHGTKAWRCMQLEKLIFLDCVYSHSKNFTVDF